MVKIFLSLIAIASLAGIFTIASESAVPGTLLYPFKVGVCESVGNLLAVGDMSKGDFYIRVAHERLLELEILTQNGAATTDRQEYLLSSFDTEVKQVSDVITVLRVEEKYDQASALTQRFQAMLTQHIAVFTALNSPAVPHLQAALDSIH